MRHPLNIGRLVLASSLCGLAASALVSVALASPTPAAHGKALKHDAAATPGASPSDGGTSKSISRIPPDPPPLVARRAWMFDLRYDKGDIYLLGVHAMDLGAPQATPRAMGRFALELYEGPTLIERVRFDFPFLHGGDLPLPEDAGRKARDDARMLGPLDKKLRTRIGVMMPATRRGTRLELWDRATDRRWQLAWPPVEGRVGAHADAAHASANDGG